MKMNRKAVGGFMEAIVAMMVVCVALTAFMGLLAYTQIQEGTAEPDFSECICDNIGFTDGAITFDESDLLKMIERYDLGKVSVIIGMHTASGDIKFCETYGINEEQTADNIHSERGISVLRCDDGTSYTVSYEVGYWYH